MKGFTALILAVPILLTAPPVLSGTNAARAFITVQTSADHAVRSWRIDHDQARNVIEAHGFNNVEIHRQSRDGTWHGTIVRYGEQLGVTVTQMGFFEDFRLGEKRK